METVAAEAGPARAVLARWRERLLRRAEARLPALTRYRGPEPLPIALHRRRIYVLPTRFGLGFALLLLVMLLGALNFNNNAALLLTFAIAGAVMVSLHTTVRQLDALRLTAVRGEPVHAGETLRVGVQLVPGDGRPRPRIDLTAGDGARHRVALGRDGALVHLSLPAPRRGTRPMGRLTLSTEYPFGVFRAWSVLHPDAALLVYPRPEPGRPPLPDRTSGAPDRRAAPQGEDWSGLRDYRSGDPRRLIAWKSSARQQRLLIKELADPRAQHLCLDWDGAGPVEREARIERLTRWVLEASARELSFTLRLPGERLGPARGLAHRAACLRALALLP